MAEPNYAQLVSTGFAVAGAIAGAYETYAATGTVAVPPVRTYFGTDHVEIDVTIRHLPPP